MIWFFVYAISRLTSLISEPVGGGIALENLFVYIITSFVILQAWLYFTNYVNRYGQWRWFEYLIAHYKFPSFDRTLWIIDNHYLWRSCCRHNPFFRHFKFHFHSNIGLPCYFNYVWIICSADSQPCESSQGREKPEIDVQPLFHSD